MTYTGGSCILFIITLKTHGIITTSQERLELRYLLACRERDGGSSVRRDDRLVMQYLGDKMDFAVSSFI